MAQRIKGLECSLALSTPDGSNEDIFEDILEANLSIDLEILERAYIGQTGNKFDDIFRGISGDMKFHMEGLTYLKFTEAVQDRATRRTPADGVFSLTFSFNFPSGARARLTCEDIFFGALPVKIPKQDEYVEGGIEFKCATLRRVY